MNSARIQSQNASAPTAEHEANDSLPQQDSVTTLALEQPEPLRSDCDERSSLPSNFITIENQEKSLEEAGWSGTPEKELPEETAVGGASIGDAKASGLRDEPWLSANIDLRRLRSSKAAVNEPIQEEKRRVRGIGGVVETNYDLPPRLAGGEERRTPARGCRGRASLEDLEKVFAKSTSPKKVPKGAIIETNEQYFSPDGRRLAPRPMQLFSRHNLHLDHEACHITKKLYEQKTKLHELDFHYVFYDADQRQKSIPKIDQINHIRRHEERRLRQEFNNLTSAFVFSQLNQHWDGGLRQLQSESIALNKVTWSDLFIKQPAVQSLLTDYFEKLKHRLLLEININGQQLADFLKFPRQLRKNKGHKLVEVELSEEYLLERRGKDEKGSGKVRQENEQATAEAKSGRPEDQTQPQANARWQADQQLCANDLIKEVNAKVKNGSATVKEPASTAKKAKLPAGEGDLSLRFLQDLPPTLRSKHTKMVESLYDCLRRERAALERYKKIVNNPKIMFNEKLQELQKLAEEYEVRESDKRHRTDMKECLKRLEAQVGDIENDSLQIENQIIQLEESSVMHRLGKREPLQKLQDRLINWYHELDRTTMDPMEQKVFAHKIWTIAEDFEEELRNEERCWKIEKRRLTEYHLNREYKLKTKYQFRIEALEMALSDLKLKSQLELDRVLMEVNDQESQKMNLDAAGYFSSIEDFIQKETETLMKNGIQQAKAHTTLRSTGLLDDDGIVDQRDVISQRTKTKQGANLNNFILGRVRQYFKMMQNQKLTEHQLKQQVQMERLKKQQAMDLREGMHRKCVKYQDLVHGLITTMTDVLSEMKCLTPQEADELVSSMQVEEFKLSIDTEQIERAIDGFAALKLPQRIVDYQHRFTGVHRKVHQLFSQNQELKQCKWVQESTRVRDWDEPAVDRLGRRLRSEEEQARYDEVTEALRLMNNLSEQVDSLYNFYDLESQCDLHLLNQPSYSDQGGSQESRRKPSKQSRSKGNLEVTLSQRESSNKQFSAQSTQNQNHAKAGKLQLKKSKQAAEKAQKAIPNISRLKSQPRIASSLDEDATTGHEQTNSLVDDYAGIRHSRGRKVVPRRLGGGAFSEAADVIISSLSKRKILYQFDQLTSTTIPTKSFKNFQLNVRADPICKALLAKNQDREHASSKDSDTGSFSSGADVEQHQDFDDLMKSLNHHLQDVYKQIQQRQTAGEGSARPTSLAKQKIVPVDCVKIEPYQAPQINILPLKLLMLRGQDERAYLLLGQALKHLSLFLDVSAIHQKLDSKARTRLDLRRKIRKERGTACNMDSESGYTLYDQMQEALLDLIEKATNQQEADRLADKAFIDEVFDNRVFQILKYSLRINSNAAQFVTDLNSRTLDLLQDAEAKGRQEGQDQRELLQKQLLEAQQQSRELPDQSQSAKSRRQGTPSKGKRQRGSTNLTNSVKDKGAYEQIKKSTKEVSKSHYGNHAEKSEAEASSGSQSALASEDKAQALLGKSNQNETTARLSDARKLATEKISKNDDRDLADNPDDARHLVLEEELPTMFKNKSFKLARAPELIQRGRTILSEEVLEALDQQVSASLERIFEETGGYRAPGSTVPNLVDLPPTVTQQQHSEEDPQRHRSNKGAKKTSPEVTKTASSKQGRQRLDLRVKKFRGENSISVKVDQGTGMTARQRDAALAGVGSYSGQAERATLTAVSMHDMQMLLENKKRSARKIESLEKEIQRLKGRLRSLTGRNTKGMRPGFAFEKSKAGAEVFMQGDPYIESSAGSKRFKGTHLPKGSPTKTNAEDYPKLLVEQRSTPFIHQMNIVDSIEAFNGKARSSSPGEREVETAATRQYCTQDRLAMHPGIFMLAPMQLLHAGMLKHAPASLLSIDARTRQKNRQTRGLSGSTEYLRASNQDGGASRESCWRTEERMSVNQAFVARRGSLNVAARRQVRPSTTHVNPKTRAYSRYGATRGTRHPDAVGRGSNLRGQAMKLKQPQTNLLWLNQSVDNAENPAGGSPEIDLTVGSQSNVYAVPVAPGAESSKARSKSKTATRDLAKNQQKQSASIYDVARTQQASAGSALSAASLEAESVEGQDQDVPDDLEVPMQKKLPEQVVKVPARQSDSVTTKNLMKSSKSHSNLNFKHKESAIDEAHRAVEENRTKAKVPSRDKRGVDIQHVMGLLAKRGSADAGQQERNALGSSNSHQTVPVTSMPAENRQRTPSQGSYLVPDTKIQSSTGSQERQSVYMSRAGDSNEVKRDQQGVDHEMGSIALVDVDVVDQDEAYDQFLQDNGPRFDNHLLNNPSEKPSRRKDNSKLLKDNVMTQDLLKNAKQPQSSQASAVLRSQKSRGSTKAQVEKLAKDKRNQNRDPLERYKQSFAKSQKGAVRPMTTTQLGHRAAAREVLQHDPSSSLNARTNYASHLPIHAKTPGGNVGIARARQQSGPRRPPELRTAATRVDQHYTHDSYFNHMLSDAPSSKSLEQLQQQAEPFGFADQSQGRIMTVASSTGFKKMQNMAEFQNYMHLLKTTQTDCQTTMQGEGSMSTATLVDRKKPSTASKYQSINFKIASSEELSKSGFAQVDPRSRQLNRFHPAELAAGATGKKWQTLQAHGQPTQPPRFRSGNPSTGHGQTKNRNQHLQYANLDPECRSSLDRGPLGANLHASSSFEHLATSLQSDTVPLAPHVVLPTDHFRHSLEGSIPILRQAEKAAAGATIPQRPLLLSTLGRASHVEAWPASKTPAVKGRRIPASAQRRGQNAWATKSKQNVMQNAKTAEEPGLVSRQLVVGQGGVGLGEKAQDRGKSGGDEFGR